jgi:hypothetical protein
MSGPITAGYFIVHGILMLSMRALREARDMKCEYSDMLEQLRLREQALQESRQGQRAARLERLSALRLQTERQLARLQRLRSVAQSMVAEEPELAKYLDQMVAPASDTEDSGALETILSGLNAMLADLEAALHRSGGRFSDQVRASINSVGRAESIDDVLAAYALRRQYQPGLNPAETERFRETARRVLARFESVPGAPLPPALEDLARDIVLAPSVERAEALVSELRLAVQRERKVQAARRAEADEARAMLDALADEAPSPLLRALERVGAGIERLDPALRDSASHVLAHMAEDRQRREEEAAAQVLQQSLRDLGYVVDDIEATLFVEGGAIHFQRKGWENYFVRMRVDPSDKEVNFNVVRARGDEETAERRRLDALAEDRWCTEFPRLLETLAARGLQLDVSRRLGAGEIPVQVVDVAALPRAVADDLSAPGRAPPRTRELP